MSTEPLRPPDASSERCAVCQHTLAEHDPISVRYCHATQAQALSRGCICPPGTDRHR